MYILKKSLAILTGFLMVLMLTACNETAKPVNESASGTENEEAKKEEASEMTLEGVLKKSTEASEELKSFSVKMDMSQEMSSGAEGENMNIDSVIDMNVTTEPMAFYQKMTMSMAEESYDIESYFTEEGMFLYEAAKQQWMKFPKEMSDDLLQMSSQQTNPGEELKKLQEFVDDFTFEQDAKSYILKLKADGEKFNDFVKETAAETLPPELAANGEMLDNMNIKGVEYEIVIDKETFYPSVLNMIMDMEITAEGQTISMKQNMNGQYSNYNKVEAIAVPQEVLDTAVEMEM
ncbi:DUF6612 family protein [Bacillus sp. 7894-2]|uniref:DUF6612 family protein n=1 Tax=Bacillus sp. 7894-2 TaxID=2021695 RepID=UPI000BA5ED43|nr:DUF6612 family protein [Bacillus sp. 7894-2]PAE24611.1 hypothetical protein CHI10_12015 [Bacillus sp. 7894-2]